MRPLPSLQALRGVAALLVVVTHAANVATGYGFARDDIELPFGNFGVDVFFVISGFIIVYASTPLFTRSRAAAHFMVRRLIRIVPLYWIVLSIYLLFMFMVEQKRQISFQYILSSYFFIPFPEPQDGAYFPFYFPGWTLELEVFFYICFSAVLVWRRPIAVLAASALMLATLAMGGLGLLPPTLGFWSSSQLLEFMAGCLIAEAYLRGARLPWPVCLMLAVAGACEVLVTSYALGGWPNLRGVVWGLPAAALAVGATLREPGALGPIETGLARLGDVSYSLYVTHLLVYDVATHVIQRVFRHWRLLPPAAYMALLLIFAVGAAFLCFHLVEKPMTRRLQRAIARPGGPG